MDNLRFIKGCQKSSFNQSWTCELGSNHVRINENGKMRTVETIPGMGGGDKGE
jgi:hypothetical protein